MLMGSWQPIDRKRFQELLSSRPDARAGVGYTSVTQDYAFTEWYTGYECPLVKTEHTRGLSNIPDYYEWIFEDESI